MNVFQWLVDVSQRRPVWWCRQCVYAIAAGVLLASVTFHMPKDFLNVLLLGVWFWLTWRLWQRSASEAALAMTGDIGPFGFRVFIWVLTAFVSVGMFLIGDPLCLSILGQSCFYAFAECRPPAPPKTRSSNRLASGTP